MGYSLTEKILKQHLTGSMPNGAAEISLKVDGTLVHDMSGPLPYIGFETLSMEEIAIDVPLTFIDHNLIGSDHKSLDDHNFVKSAAKKYGSIFSGAGNGICHTLYFSRFGKPGMLLAGADSHCSTAGSIGMLGIGMGGLDIAVIMSGEPLHIKKPEIINVRLTGTLNLAASAKDVALTFTKKVGVTGGVGKIFEFTGDGLACLTVPMRATIVNICAETGATSGIFSSDDNVLTFLKAQGRQEDFISLLPDSDAVYNETIEIDLSKVRPMSAKPSMPDNVTYVSELSDIQVNQVYIGSCSNGSYTDIARAAKILEGQLVSPDVSLVVSPSSRQIFQMLLKDGYIEMLVNAGARILECGCGPCIGLGQATATNGVSVRTSNRNYPGRSGTKSASVYLVSPETAAATAITGYITEASELIDMGILNLIEEPACYIVDDSLVIRYNENKEDTELIRGPNIKPMPVKDKLESEITAKVVLKTQDNITTDDIIPPSPEVLMLRSNVPALAESLFSNIDSSFASRAKEYKSSIIVGGKNYGQGSSREHAAIAPMYLGIKAVLAKSIARIHKSNLINYGIIPLIFEDENDYSGIHPGDELIIEDIYGGAERGSIAVVNKTKGVRIQAALLLSEREKDVLLAGGLLAFIRDKRKGGQ